MKFQFHKGAIRTIANGTPDTDNKGFQFHKGAIRTWKRYEDCYCVFSISIP